jgi:hypothetical protein
MGKNDEEMECQTALDARKSLYEKWQDSMRFPWRRAEDHGVAVDASGRVPCTERDAQLVAAAPLLLDALLEMRKLWVDECGDEYAEVHVDDAIRAALPEDVVAEVLGEDQS